MRIPTRQPSTLAVALIAVLLVAAAPQASAAKRSATPAKPATPAAEATAEAPATDVKFRDFFQMPVGPKGLELTEQIRALDGKRVRIVGYMVKNDQPVAGMFILSPLPVELGDEDESLADDLPPSSLFVHLADEATVPFHPGLIRLTGTLSIGSREERDDRVSMLQLQLDRNESRSLLAPPPQHASR